MAGTGTTKPEGGTGDPGDHPRCRFFGGPELDIVTKLKKNTDQEKEKI